MEGQDKRCQRFCFNFSEHYSMSNILPKDSSKVGYTHKLIVSKKFDNFAKIPLRVTETGPSRIHVYHNDVASGSEITPCNKIDKQLVVYRLTGNFMTSITTLRTYVLRQK